MKTKKKLLNTKNTLNIYYAIHLSKYDCASFFGKLCQIGMMKITNSNYTYSK